MDPKHLTTMVDTVQKHLPGKHDQETHAGGKEGLEKLNESTAAIAKLKRSDPKFAAASDRYYYNKKAYEDAAKKTGAVTPSAGDPTVVKIMAALDSGRFNPKLFSSDALEAAHTVLSNSKVAPPAWAKALRAALKIKKSQTIGDVFTKHLAGQHEQKKHSGKEGSGMGNIGNPLHPPGTRKMAPTRKHVPLVWEGILGTVYAMDPHSGKVQYFDYNWKDAHAYAGIDTTSDLRIWRNRERTSDGPGRGQWTLYGVHGDHEETKHLAGKHDQQTHAGGQGEARVTITPEESRKPDRLWQLTDHLRGNGVVDVRIGGGRTAVLSNVEGAVAVDGVVYDDLASDAMSRHGSLVNVGTVGRAIKMAGALGAVDWLIEEPSGYKGDRDEAPSVMDWNALRNRTERIFSEQGVSEDYLDEFIDSLDSKTYYGRNNYRIVGPTFVKDYGTKLNKLVKGR